MKYCVIIEMEDLVEMVKILQFYYFFTFYKEFH